MKEHIVMMSGGIESYAMAKIVASTYGKENIILLFADTKTEDADLYRFLEEAALDVGSELIKIVDGRNIWEVFRDVRFLGNSRVDPCSRILKREPLLKWMEQNCDQSATKVYIGYRHDEDGRMAKAMRFWSPWKVFFPLKDANVDKCDIRRWMDEGSIRPPTLYEEGFEHNNCGGGCVKMGIGQAVHLLKQRPATFAQWEDKEKEMQVFLGDDVTILKDRRGGGNKRMSLTVLRERHESGEKNLGRYENHACSCMSGDDQ